MPIECQQLLNTSSFKFSRNCHKLSADEIEATFHNHRDALRCIYDEYKNKTEVELRDSELCNYTEVISVLTDDQAYAMIRCLEQELTPEDERGMVKLR